MVRREVKASPFLSDGGGGGGWQHADFCSPQERFIILLADYVRNELVSCVCRL